MALDDHGLGPRRARPPAIPLPFDARRVTIACAVIAGALVLLGVTTALVYDARDVQSDRWLELVDVNGEANVPTWFSVSLLTSGAVAVAAVAKSSRMHGRDDAAAWRFVASFVTLMSIDEMVGLHESVGAEVDDVVTFPVIGGYGWIVPGTLVALVGVVVLRRAIVPLPRRAQGTIALALVLFGTGAVGLEVVEAVVTGAGTDVGPTFFLVTGAQELLEMLGAALFLYAMLVELQRRETIIDLRDATSKATPRAEATPLTASGRG